ncbi:chromobox protein homolog 5 isoform X1 [Anabrus simplex]|uniref:chromobox protein homolog 5 isoform X1 n=1 Tax=Anabrus simplex TaxID=316456 RepID=UPI0035A33F96
MRRLSTKAKKAKAEQSSSESTGTEEEKVAAAGNGNEASENESESEDKPSPKKKSKRGKKNDASQKANEDGIADEGSEKRKRRSTGTAKSEDNDEEAAEEEYEVEKVVDSKIVRGQTQYKIRWKGFSPENDTWEPEEDLNCPELIQEFLKSQPEEAKGKDSKNKKRGGKTSAAEPKSKKKKKDSEEETAEGEDEEEDEEKVYEVEKVVEVHFKKNGKREFLIRWKGFSSNDDTWEPEENLSCPDLIEKFMAKVDKARNTNARELRVNPQHTDRFTLNMSMQGRRLSRRHGSKGRTTYHGAE